MDQNGDNTRCLHRRQFILGPRPVKPDTTWQSHEIAGDLILSHSSALPILHARDRDGVPWLLLGRAVSIHADAPPIAQQIALQNTGAVAACTFAWSGRWVLISPSTVLTDASALLGVIYGHASDGSLWVSSSAALLAEHALAHKAPLADDRRLQYEQGLSWFPPPATRHAALSRLLPSQALDIQRGKAMPRAWLPTISASDPHNGGIAWLGQALRAVLQNLTTCGGGPVHLGLTAGYDSRLMLAIALAADLPIHSFTRRTKRMSLADRFIPPQLVAGSGIPHQFLPEGSIATGMETLLKTHALDMVSRGDAAPLLRDGRASLNGINIGGHGFAIASGFANWRNLPDTLPETDLAVPLILDVINEPRRSPAATGLRDWVEWVQATPVPGLDWRDRMFIEQRQAGWLAAKEQLYDVKSLERFPILNSAEIYAGLLSIPEADRKGSKVQEQLIRMIYPPLSAAPYNPPDWRYALRCPHIAVSRYYTRMARKFIGRAQRMKARR